MTTLNQAKSMAANLRASLSVDGVDISHSKSLEMISKVLGHKDWNTASALMAGNGPNSISFDRCIPILRIFDEAKAREFYFDFLGFKETFQHRFEESLPLYMGIERAGLTLHLSEHYGDASPGSTIFVEMTSIAAYHRELSEKRYSYNRPGIEDAPWGRQLEVHDPFGNRIRFCEMKKSADLELDDTPFWKFS
ncbi:glyoxalase superfamily protein [Ahrensia marina]|uniref:glyoxalase superfamily protein n=1 Tax=Ahrensia marina TaxID=1514904 RepID=UPI0006B671F1|nr:glyoxalase superfamily protein [Ahrensia marina]